MSQSRVDPIVRVHKNLIAFRNEKEVLHATRYVGAEIEAQINTYGPEESSGTLAILTRVKEIIQEMCLGSPNKTLQVKVDEFMNYLSNLAEAEKAIFEGVEAQLAEIEEERALFVARPPSVDSTGLKKKIDGEIHRRAKKRELLATEQEDHENTRDGLLEQIQILQAQIKRDQLSNAASTKIADKSRLESQLHTVNGLIAGLVTSIAQHDAALMHLQSYTFAMQLVEKGLPEGIMGELDPMEDAQES